MGNCTSHNKAKPSSKYNSSVKIQFPDMFYLDRKDKSLLSIRSTGSFKLQLKKLVRVYKDSSISLMEDNSLMICGGSDSSGSLTSGVYQISTEDNCLIRYPNLPIPCKYGKFLSNDSYFYYIGGICESQDPDSVSSEEAGPLCRLNKKTLKWDIFICRPDFNPSKFLQRKIFTEENPERLSVYAPSGVKLKDLFEPGAAMFDNRIYLFGGKIFKKDFIPTNKIFSIDIQESNFSISEEQASLPIALVAPSCVMKRDLAIIAGGFLVDMSVNLEVFLVDCTHGTIRKFDVIFDRPIEPRFPIITDGKGIACMAPPKILYVREDKTSVFHLNMPSEVETKKLKVIDNENSNDLEVSKMLVNLRINFIVEEQPEPRETEKKMDEFVVIVNQPKYTENPFEECEEINALATSNSETPIKLKAINCECGVLISSNRLDDLKFKCGHCGISKNKLYKCQSCQKILCKTCANGLQNYKPLINPSLKCKENHYFCTEVQSLQGSERLCCNCLITTTKTCYFCFVCQTYLCEDCEIVINQTTSPVLLKCSLDHTFKWVLLSSISSASSICDTCLEQIKQIGYFYCTACRHSLCFFCVRNRQEMNPENKYFSKANTYQEKPKRLSETFYKNEINQGDEPSLSRSKILQSKASFSNIIAKAQKIELIDPEAGNDTPTRQKFETSYHDIKKKAIPKPLRSANPPLFSLSPRRKLNDSNPNIKAVGFKMLNNSSEESLNHETNEAQFPHVLNPFSIRLIQNESQLQAKVLDTNENVSSVKLSEFLKTNERDLEVSQCVNPLEIQDASYICHNQTFNDLASETSHAPSFDQMASISSNLNVEPGNQLRLSSDLIAGREVSIGFSECNESSSVFVAPDIRGTLAASKLTALKAKLNLLTSLNDEFSSTSENESFQEIVFRPYKDSSVSQFSSSAALAASQSLSKRESKRYTNHSESFSKESNKSAKRKVKEKNDENRSSYESENLENSIESDSKQESDSSGYEDFEIQYE